ncbi:zinc finger and SCAN domain-containing protein 5B [Enhydra lutris kenyoni]|uniref:Zinc finger and SCAN domain-containing protein 5B n=1 Tax=Enhydra lutris kenyoni TaxID=391180 RepID=A0A2Y9IG27_ENHLU|nr:zinc finger and SCAN domain-containing protein 5B [Enhydra lutris kenyoni]
MATDQNFSGGQDKPQGSPETDLRQSIPSQGAHDRTRGNRMQDGDCETWHLSFRAFTGSETSDPLEDLRRLGELCYLWLRPDLHTKEQILDALVLEQFLISMPPELQVLVKESGVRSCKDLRDLLRSNETPKTWTIVTLQGQEFLVQSSDAQMAGAEVSDMDLVADLSKKPPSSMSETRPEDSEKVSRELQNLPGVDEPSAGQAQNVLLLETIPGKGVQDSRRPKGNLKENLMEDPEERTILKFQEPQLLESPDSMKAKGGKNLQEGAHITDVHADRPSAHVSEGQTSPRSGNRRDSQKSPRNPKRRKLDNTSISKEVPQGGTPYLDKGEVSAQPASSSVHPVGVKATGQTPTGQTPTVCSICKRGFRYKSQFRVHWRTHTGERPFRCDVCAGAFTQPSDLRVHQRIHTGEKPYSCELCHQTFTHDSTLRSHRRVHTKEKPYACADCGKAFSHKGNLNVHLRTHSGLKPYTCPECHGAFRQLGTFKRHQKTHAK